MMSINRVNAHMFAVVHEYAPIACNAELLAEPAAKGAKSLSRADLAGYRVFTPRGEDADDNATIHLSANA